MYYGGHAFIKEGEKLPPLKKGKITYSLLRKNRG